MSAFWSIAAAMLVAAIGLLAAALLRKREVHELDRDAQNVRIARERMVELAAEHEEGRLADGEFEQAKLELEQSLLGDLGATPPAAGKASALSGRLTAGGLLVLVPLVAIILYLSLGSPQYIDKRGPGAGADETPTMAHEAAGLPPIDQLVTQLKDKLAKNPEDPKGWYLLARSYSSLGRHAEAAQAFEKVLSLVGDNARVMVSLADALAMAQGGKMAGRPAELVTKVLETDPNDSTALWLAGMAEEEKGNLEQALDHWKRLYPLLTDDANARQELRGMMEAVQTKLGRPVADLRLAEAAPAPAAATQVTPVSSSATQATPVSSSAGRSITVKVSLDGSLSGRVDPSDTLFVFARAVSGPPMPLAVARKKVSDLPLTVTLDDSMAMMPAMRLSNFDQVSVTARVSKSGQPIASSGDLQSDPVTVGRDQSAPLALVISQAVP